MSFAELAPILVGVEPDLDAVLAAARAGDEAAMTQLFRQVHPGLLQYLRRRAPDVAEDLASETWMAAAGDFSGFAGDIGDFRAWLFTVARRRVADHYRRCGRTPSQVAWNGDLDGPPSPDVGEQVLADMATDEAVARLVRNLSPDQSEVVLLRVVAGLSVDEAAQAMGRSAGTVRVLQHRALRRLRKVWDRQVVTR